MESLPHASQNLPGPELWTGHRTDKPLRFFNLDMHVSVIADLRTIFNEMGHDVTDWSLSGHAWVFGKTRDRVDIVNENTWTYLNPEMADAFYERYQDVLAQFDAFIVTYPPAFALLFERCNKPVIVVVPIRYECPFTGDPVRWNWLNERLREGVAQGRIFLVANNKADQLYLRQHGQLESTWIPSLCYYTQAQATHQKRGFIVRGLPPRDLAQEVASALPNPELIQNHALPRPYTWQELYSYQGLVHFPYTISTMSIFEQYSANVPLFFPTKRFLCELMSRYPDVVLSQLSFYTVYGLPIPTRSGDLNNVADPQVVQTWLDHADFYDLAAMPHLQYFDSFAELAHLLQTVDGPRISALMRAHNRSRQAGVKEQWRRLLDNVEQVARGRASEARR